MAFTDGPAESIGRGAVEYQSPIAAAPADGCGVIAVGANLVFTDSPVATKSYVDGAIAAIELTPGPAGATGPVGPNLVSGSTATALLGLLYANGANVAVASSANVITALGYTPANRAGDTFTGNVLVGSGQTDGGTGAKLSVATGIYTPGWIWATGGITLTAANIIISATAGSLAVTRFTSGAIQLVNGGPVLQNVGSTGFSLLQSDGVTAANLAARAITSNVRSTFSGGITVNSSALCVNGVWVDSGASMGMQNVAGNLSVHSGGQSVIRVYGNSGFPTVSGVRIGSVSVDQSPSFDGSTLIVRPQAATCSAIKLEPFTGQSAPLLDVGGAIVASGLVRVGVFTAATLPSASANAGAFAQVSDSSVTTNGSPVAGGGSNRVIVFSNASTWDVVVA